MASTIKKTANALSSESDLLNVYADLKAVCNKFENFLGASESAQKRILKWAEKLEGDAIQDFLRSLYDIETERFAIDRRYNDHFRIFVKLWKGILSEKKELNSKLKEYESVRKTEKSLTQKVSKAEAKEPQHKVEQRMLELEQARRRTAEVSQEAAQKLLEVQQDKHQTLRTGYTGLYGATMSRIKEHVDLLEKMRQLVNGFPAVVARNEDGTYVHEPYAGQLQDCPIWWQGERLYKQLADIKNMHEEEKRRAAKEYSSRLDEMVRQQEAAAKGFEQMHAGELSNMTSEQQRMIANLNSAHQARVADLEEQMAALEKLKIQELAAEATKYRNLEGVLDSTKHRLENQLAEYAKLDKLYENTLLQMVARSHKQAMDDVSHASIWSKQACMNTFMDAAGQSKAAAESLLPVLESDIDGKSEMIQLKLASLAAQVTTTLLSAAGAAQCSRAESSHELVESLSSLPEAADSLLVFFDIEVASRSADQAARADSEEAEAAPAPAEEPVPKVRALYRHEQKEQEGFRLIGFEKGDILILVKRREDGWSRVKSDNVEGWAPTSYLEDYEEPPPARSVSAESTASSAGGSDRAKPDPKTAIAAFCGIIDGAVEIAKKMQLRDRELAKLSNQVANAIEEKMTAAQQSISDAVTLFQRLLAQSKSTESGRLLEVNTQLLERALLLENGMENVIGASEGLRNALLSTKGSQGESEFNAKHQSWFEALTASVEAVHEGNPMLTEAIRCVLGRKGKHEELQVACRNITSTCAHLAALSKTKKGSGGGGDAAQHQVVAKCAEVMTIGQELLAAARESQDLSLASVLMADFSELTDNQCKRLTMATQVNVLKLEKELEQEREKLGRLRKLSHQGDKYK
mmetsp:Transcript_36963/g.96834  ORF Transcript_36963/g.96834 Transcript_36963/m.96834 type:complete len:863 (+) Transcript_36963:109-2697(+)